MNKTEFFVLVCDYCNAIKKAAETQDKADQNMAQNTFLKIKAECKKYEEAARHKLEIQKLKTALDLQEVKE